MITALVSQKGGSSKSTLAVSIAWELMARGAKVLLVDTDPQKTVSDVGAIAGSTGQKSPTIVAMGEKLYLPDQLPRLAQAFDHVIIDTPGRSGAIQNAALLASDVALIPVGQSAAEVWAVSGTLEIVNHARDLKATYGQVLKTALVVTRKMPRTTLGKAVRDTLKESGMRTFTAETSLRVAWQTCLGAGQGVAQFAPKDEAAKELRALVDELLAFAAETTHQEVANG